MFPIPNIAHLTCFIQALGISTSEPELALCLVHSAIKYLAAAPAKDLIANDKLPSLLPGVGCYRTPTSLVIISL